MFTLPSYRKIESRPSFMESGWVGLIKISKKVICQDGYVLRNEKNIWESHIIFTI